MKAQAKKWKRKLAATYGWRRKLATCPQAENRNARCDCLCACLLKRRVKALPAPHLHALCPHQEHGLACWLPSFFFFSSCSLFFFFFPVRCDATFSIVIIVSHFACLFVSLLSLLFCCSRAKFSFFHFSPSQSVCLIDLLCFRFLPVKVTYDWLIYWTFFFSSRVALPTRFILPLCVCVYAFFFFSSLLLSSGAFAVSEEV